MYLWKHSSDHYVYVIPINISVGIRVLKPHNKFITPEGVREGSRGKTPGVQFRRRQTKKQFHFPLYLTHSIGVSSPHRGQFVNSSATWHNTQPKVQETKEREKQTVGGWTCVFSRLSSPSEQQQVAWRQLLTTCNGEACDPAGKQCRPL